MDSETFFQPASDEEKQLCRDWQPDFKGNIEHLVKLHRILRDTPRSSDERRDALALWEAFNKTRNDSDEISVNGENMAVKIAYEEEVIGLDLKGLALSEIVGPISFEGADLRESRFLGASLTGADFSRANMSGSIFADGGNSGLAPAFLLRTNFTGADITACNFAGAIIADSQFQGCIADIYTCFDGADLQGANFNNAKLFGASMKSANLQLAQLNETDLRSVKLSGSDVYGATVISPLIDKDTEQEELRVTPVEPSLSVNRSKRQNVVAPPGPVPSFHTNSLEHANLLHLMRNTDLAGLFGAITQKGVLLLGRFEKEHGEVLDALRENLRKRGYLPMKFDFDKPGDRTLKETILTLAGLSHFVVADITEASSVPLELATIAREFHIPIVPIKRAGRRTFSMFDSFARDYREQVLEPLEYVDIDQLLGALDAAIIQPAEAKHNEIIEMKARPLKVRMAIDFN